jgi:hypothetical protein
MDASVLEAVLPYSFLLSGKLGAMLAASDKVRRAFEKKYGGTCAVILREVHDGRLALITTASALGRFCGYSRLRFGHRLLYQSVCFSRGIGKSHFLNGLCMYRGTRDDAPNVRLFVKSREMHKRAKLRTEESGGGH